MEDDTKCFVAFFVVLGFVVLGLFAYCAYDLHMRTSYLSGASDPIAAACAYDSSEEAFPPSCVAHLYQQKEVINAIR